MPLYKEKEMWVFCVQMSVCVCVCVCVCVHAPKKGPVG